MNAIVKNKLITYLVVLLLVANFIAMVMYWVQRYKDDQAPMNAKDSVGASAFLMDKLGFDSAQLVAFKQLQQTHQQAIRAMKDSMHLAKDQFFDLLEKDSVTEQELMSGASLAASRQVRLDRITFDFFKSVQKLCNPDQRIIFKQVIKEALRIMGRPAPPPGRRPGGPRNQGPNDGPPQEGPPQEGPPQNGPPREGPPQ